MFRAHLLFDAVGTEALDLAAHGEQNTRLAGELLVKNLVNLIAGEEVDSELLDVELILRESCGARP